MSTYPFPTDPVMTAITIAYTNKVIIADGVLPRIKVGKTTFRYFKHDLSEGLSIPHTQVGRKSQVSEISFAVEEMQESTKDYALDDPIPYDDIKNAPKGFDPKNYAVMTMTKLIQLEREVRVANKVFVASTYPTGNKVQLGGTSQWSDFTTSDPIGDINSGLDVPIFRPNTMVIGRAAYSKLSQHPEVVKAAHGNAGDSGIAKRSDIAEIFELDNVLVGEAYLNTAAKGQPVTLQRVWGKHTALLYIDPDVKSPESSPTFGFTGEYLGRIAGSERDSKIGMRGGERVRVGESVAEVISASDLGYFLEDVIA